MSVLRNTYESTTVDARGASTPPRFPRSGQMVNCLRQERLYSEKRVRDLLFGAVATTIARQSSEALIVARLTREATAVARAEAARIGLEFAHWDTASKAVVKALLCSGSLLSRSGEAIPFDVTAHAAEVGALRDDYHDRTEAYLLEFLLRRLGDVTVRDHKALAHALFRQFDPNVNMHDLEDRVALLLARLADRVTLDGEVYVVRAH